LNSVLVITSAQETFREVERWLSRLDQPFATAGMRNYIYKVQNSKAEDIQNVLSQLYGGASPAPPLAEPSGPDTASTAQAGAFGSTQTAPAPGGGQAVSDGETRIVADTVTNSLIVHATPQDYAGIRQTIEALDILPRQVLVDAQIFEVALDDSLSFGVTAALQNRGTLANPQTTASFVGTPPSASAQTFAFVGRTRELVMFLNASENRSRVRTVSSPSVLVSDNMTAQFQVGAEVPIPTTSSITPVQSDGTNLFAQTITFRTTGVLLNVRPQINESGRVTLEIAQEVSQAGTNTTSDIVAPVIGKSSVTSTIVVQDGQTIALGGFIRENQELARSRIPLLGRIPGLGVLFGNTRNATTRSELVILITPHVIRDFDAAALATEELRSRLEEIQELLND
jgi:general secretion pathway protein D